jgi:hypothetical protein
MPNHETNTVVIVGDHDKIRAFIAEGLRPLAADDNSFNSERPERVIDFALIVPEPENIERGGCSGTHQPGVVCWYKWNIANWGTKWGAYAHTHYQLRFFDGYARVDLRFETAWSQPAPIFKAIESRWGLQVHAVTQDEGGHPDVVYGDPFGEDLIAIEHVFRSWDREIDQVDGSGARLAEGAPA